MFMSILIKDNVEIKCMLEFLKVNGKKNVYLVMRKGALLLAHKNNMINDVPSLESFYHDSNRAGWRIVADQVYARDEHEAALKVHFLTDAHGFMVAVCFINLLLVAFSPNFAVNKFLFFASITGYMYAIWKMYQFQSPVLKNLSCKKCKATSSLNNCSQ